MCFHDDKEVPFPGCVQAEQPGAGSCCRKKSLNQPPLAGLRPSSRLCLLAITALFQL
jgi:hypothetical protein